MTRKMGTRLAGWTWCTLAALAVPVLAHAQSDTPVTRAAQTDGERAAPFFQEGLRAADQKQWNEAEAAYLKAWKITKAFDLAANLGIVELKLGKSRLAATHLAFSLRTAPPSTKAPYMDRTRQLIEQAKQQIGVLRVRLNVPEAEVSIDGKPLSAEESADEIFVEPGTHRVVAHGLDYFASEQIVTVQAGSSQEVAFSLQPLPAAAPRPHEPARDAPAPPAPPAAERSWVPVIALGAASAVGLGVGVGLTVASNGASEDAHAQSAAIRDARGRCVKAQGEFASSCAELERTVSRSDGFRDGARVAYLASGALVVAAVTYALWPRAQHAASGQLRALPDVRSDGASIAVIGVW
jgi:hypothetical protein